MLSRPATLPDAPDPGDIAAAEDASLLDFIERHMERQA